MEEDKILAKIKDEMYITEEEKELIELFRTADDVTKRLILSMHDIYDEEEWMKG